MKPSPFVLISLVTLFALLSCSQVKKEGKPLFGDEYTEAEYEEGSWEVRDDVLVAFEDLPARGAIGFQGKHGESSISYRNVRIMEL